MTTHVAPVLILQGDEPGYGGAGGHGSGRDEGWDGEHHGGHMPQFCY